MEMMIDLLAEGWLYPLKGAPKPLGELRPVVIFFRKIFYSAFNMHVSLAPAPRERYCVYGRRRYEQRKSDFDRTHSSRDGAEFL